MIFLVGIIRTISIFAVISGVALLIFDSPAAIHFPAFIRRPVVEATPLILVGIALVAWLAVERPSISDLIKQGFIALAFILWGIDILIPIGPGATFIGAVVIAIYVFDLAWLLEGNLRKKIEDSRDRSATSNTETTAG